MYELDTTWTRTEADFRARQMRRSIVGRRVRNRIKAGRTGRLEAVLGTHS